MELTSHILDPTEYILPLDLSWVFKREGEFGLEIGFGDGAFLIEVAKDKPEWNFVGVEIKRKRYVKALKRAEKEGVYNVKFLLMDARVAVEDVFSKDSFFQVYINFPDPWPKDRHKKHRLINPDFLAKLAQIMKPKGTVEIASDHKEYISQILNVFRKSKTFENPLPYPGYITRVLDRTETKYEKEFREEGREIFYMRFRCMKD